MLQHSSSRSARASWLWPVATALIASLIPLRLVADRARPEAASVAPDMTEATALAPASPAAQAARDDQPEKRERDAARKEKPGRTSWVYLHEDEDSVTMSGDMDDIGLAKRLRGPNHSAFFLFGRDGHLYAISDASTLESIRKILAPQEELGRQQGELGEKQGKLGEQQGKLGERQGALGERQAEFGAKQAEIATRMAVEHAELLSASGEHMQGRLSEEDLRKRERALSTKTQDAERQLREQSERHTALAEEQAELGHEQERLGHMQSLLGEEQARLGELQREASEKAEQELRELVDRALAQGLAKEIK